jgi:acyl carrier protein
MGMDSVELIMSFERHFKLEIPDDVAENIRTVGDMADWLNQQLGLAGQHHSAVRLLVWEQLYAVLVATSSKTASYSEATPLREALPNRQQLESCRQQLLSRYGLLMPRLSPVPATPAAPSLWEKIWGRPLWSPPSWPTQTLAELTDWLVATNYERLLCLPLVSRYEVEQAVIGITSYSSGVEIEEVQLRSSFTNDLGID